MINIEILGWAATFTLLLGYVLNAKKKISSWLTWMAGNVIMTVYGLLIGSYPLVFLSIVLICLNAYGYFSWKKDNK